MRKRIVIGISAALAVIAAVFYAAPFQGTAQPLAGYFPSGALLYLEAKDFSAELRDWNSSGEQRRWLASTRYQGFSRSNLFLKMQSAWAEFTGAAGFLPDSAFVQSLAGGQSGLAIYDIGDLAFLYVTRLPNAQAMQTALWQSRAKYETRHAGGVDFFVRVDSGRTVAFASTGGYLILGTREELVAGALRLLSGESLTAVAQEPWYADASAAAGAQGELRLVTNLDGLVKSPQFRTYWIQRNATEIRDYRAAISDLVRSSGEFREERVLLRKTAAGAIQGGADGLFRLVPDDAAYSQAWAQPSAEQVTGLVEQKLLAPRVTTRGNFDFAPPVDLSSGESGDASDLETRIDEPPLASQSTIALDGLRRLLSGAPLDAVLQVQSGEVLPDGVFVSTPTVVAVQSARPWDLTAAQNALSVAAASLWTSSGSGTGWVAHQRGGQTWYAMDGLASLQMAVAGNLLIFADSEALFGRILDRIDLRPAPSGATSIALFRHLAARDDYRRLTAALDHAEVSAARPFNFGTAQRPAFFSVDLLSLSDIFTRVREVEVRSRGLGSSVQETVTYRLNQ